MGEELLPQAEIVWPLAAKTEHVFRAKLQKGKAAATRSGLETYVDQDLQTAAVRQM